MSYRQHDLFREAIAAARMRREKREAEAAAKQAERAAIWQAAKMAAAEDFAAFATAIAPARLAFADNIGEEFITLKDKRTWPCDLDFFFDSDYVRYVVLRQRDGGSYTSSPIGQLVWIEHTKQWHWVAPHKATHGIDVEGRDRVAPMLLQMMETPVFADALALAQAEPTRCRGQKYYRPWWYSLPWVVIGVVAIILAISVYGCGVSVFQ